MYRPEYVIEDDDMIENQSLFQILDQIGQYKRDHQK